MADVPCRVLSSLLSGGGSLRNSPGGRCYRVSAEDNEVGGSPEAACGTAMLPGGRLGSPSPTDTNPLGP